MSKITFEKPGNFIYPVPAVLVSLQDKSGKKNIVTIAWTGTVCSDPPMAYISAPTIEEAPVSIECVVKDIIPLGSHDMFLSEVVAVDVDEKYIDKKNAFHMEDAKLIAYSHGDYMSLGKKLGDFGFSVRKKPRH